MSGHRKWSELRAPVDPERRAQIDEEKRVMGAIMALHEMRERRGVSQEELARAWDTSQPNVSKIEHKDDLLISTVRRYVEALGGRLEVQAVFPDQTVRLELGGTEKAIDVAEAIVNPSEQQDRSAGEREVRAGR